MNKYAEKARYRASRKASRHVMKDGAKCGKPKCQVCHYEKVHGIVRDKYKPIREANDG